MSLKKYWKTLILAVTLAAGGLWAYVHDNSNMTDKNNYTSKLTDEDISLSAKQSYDDLVKKGFQPRADTPPWKFSTPVDWKADPYNDRNWQFQLHAWRGIDPILVKYYDTDNVEYIYEAIEYMVDWQEFHQNDRQAKFSWYDMAAGLRALRIALVIDEIYEGKINVSKSDLKALLSLADQHAIKLKNEEFISLGNHGVFQVFGLNALCTIVGDRPSCDNGTQFAQRMFEKILDHAYTDEGVHKEHSPFYHHYTTVAINRFDASKFDSKRALRMIGKAREITPWLAWPDGHFVEVGDTEGKTYPLSRKQDLECLDDERCYAVGDYTNSGYAIVRSDPTSGSQDSMLFVTGMAYSTTHKHADGLSFSLLEHGEKIFIDSGKYGYERNEWWDYTRSASAHNTISLIGEKINRGDVNKVGSLLTNFEKKENSFSVSGELSRPGFFSQQREIEYTPGETLEISDSITSPSERSFVSSLHLAPHLTPELIEKGFKVKLTSGEVVVARLENRDCKIDSSHGQKEPVLGWYSVGYLDMEPTYVVRAVCPGISRTINWTISF